MNTKLYDGNTKVNWSEVGWQPKENQVPAKVLKLSEAIRIGAKRRPDCRKQFGDGVGSCALMAAAEGSGADYALMGNSGALIKEHLDRAIPNWRRADEAMFKWRHGVEPIVSGGTSISSTHFNGIMSREQIADWLEARGF